MFGHRVFRLMTRLGSQRFDMFSLVFCIIIVDCLLLDCFAKVLFSLSLVWFCWLVWVGWLVGGWVGWLVDWFCCLSCFDEVVSASQRRTPPLEERFFS